MNICLSRQFLIAGLLLTFIDVAFSNTLHQPTKMDSAEINLYISDSSGNNQGLKRNCSPIYSTQNLYYFWHVPHPVYGDTSFAQRFTFVEPESIQAIEFHVYDEGNGTFGNDDVHITIYHDNGAGLPAAEIAKVTLAAGTYPAYPALVVADFSSLNLVLEGEYHVAFSTSGTPGIDYENLVSSDIVYGTRRSTGSGDPNSPGWYIMADWWDVDINFFFVVVSCRSQFTQCGASACYSFLIKRWALPNDLGIHLFAQKATPSTEACRVGRIDLRLAWPVTESTLPLYSYNTEVQIYDDSGGYPGIVLASKIIGPAEYAAAGLTHPTGTRTLPVDFTPLGINVSGDFWVGIESLAPDSTSGIRVLTDGGTGPCTNGFAWKSSNWEYVSAVLGLPETIALGFQIGYCCVPRSLIEVPNDYSTIQQAINVAFYGDTVLVYPGTYLEQISLFGKRIVVASLFYTTGDTSFISSTIINGNRPGPTVFLNNGENDSTKLIGFTIQHTGNLSGEGVFCDNSSPLISNNHIVHNSGSGIACIDAHPDIRFNLVEANSALRGGALNLSNSTPNILSNILLGNFADSGGAIYSRISNCNLVNCTIVGNMSTKSGIINLNESEINVNNSIIAFNRSTLPTWFCQGPPSSYLLNCTDIFGNTGGNWNLCGTPLDTGSYNFSLNPLFCNVLNGDLRLNELSPCTATNSLCGALVGALDVGCSYLCGDADGDGEITLSDVTFIEQFYFDCNPAPTYYGAADANCDGEVDLRDVIYLAAYLNSIGQPPCCP